MIELARTILSTVADGISGEAETIEAYLAALAIVFGLAILLYVAVAAR